MWDLERENCIAQLNLPASGSGGDGVAPAAEHIAASCHSPLLYAADGSGMGETEYGASARMQQFDAHAELLLAGACLPASKLLLCPCGCFPAHRTPPSPLRAFPRCHPSSP